MIPLEIQCAILCDSFINISVAKGLDEYSILKIIYQIKISLENKRVTSPSIIKDTFIDFTKKPKQISNNNDCTAKDFNFIHHLFFSEYQSQKKRYAKAIKFMENFRKIEEVILDACNELQSLSKAEHTDISTTEIISHIKGTYNNDDDATLKMFIERFLSTFNYKNLHYSPINSYVLFDFYEKGTSSTLLMIDELQQFAVFSKNTYSKDMTNFSTFFS